MKKVSIIIPTYNRSKYILRAVNSALNQTYDNIEIIIIDDGSTDNTKEILQPVINRVVYINQDNGGISAARNTGIKASTGEYIAFLDSDDEWIPEKLSLQIPIMEQNTNIGITFSQCLVLNENNERCGYRGEKNVGLDFDTLIKFGGVLPTSSIVTRRECFDKVGLFDETLELMEDIEMWIRIAHVYEIIQIKDQFLSIYYLHTNQETKNVIKVYEGTVDLDRKILNIYKNIPKKLISNRLASNEYLLSRAYFNNQEFTRALNTLYKSIKRNWLVGNSFIDKNDNIIVKSLKTIKPFIFLVVCLFKNAVRFISK